MIHAPATAVATVRRPRPDQAGSRAASDSSPLLGQLHDDSGNAVVEFLGLAVTLLVPLVYLVLVLGRLQAGTFAADAASREAARVYATSTTPDSGRAITAVGLALRDQGFDADPARALQLGCSARCLAPGSDVEAVVQVRVPLPFVPPFVRSVVPLEVAVSATHTAVVDDYRAEP